MNTAIIVAAGTGSRFAASHPKQFVEILGKPLLIHTLERFQSCPLIHEIVLVLSEAGRREFEVTCQRFEISKLRSIVTGGESRAESVRNGLDATSATDSDIVAIHDGARPLVSVDEISRTVEKAIETGAACLVAEVTDTIKEVGGKYISRTIERENLRRALTPQAFRYDVIRPAFCNVDLSDSITDECYLVEKRGFKVSFVEGSARNIKITRQEDLLFAESIIRAEKIAGL